jgi:hypothetical protein
MEMDNVKEWLSRQHFELYEHLLGMGLKVKMMSKNEMILLESDFYFNIEVEVYLFIEIYYRL